ncbi:MAG: glutathione S-transferase N-terminal domain-containing protein [Gammaproteobacteria bacterium]|nr:glutathione S-transferase N-terminal domain-containing protein [Gammaproteobacteria bacterium]
MHIIHSVLGSIILFFDWLFTPKGIKRDTETQENIDGLTSRLSLYQYKACPFCVKVRRAMKRNSLNIQTYDAKRSETSRKELIEGGGRLKVPCLKVECAEGEVNWIYESSDIIAYLESGLAANSFTCKAV